ncbi:MAG: phage tail protein [Pseudomonadota bacterium]
MFRKVFDGHRCIGSVGPVLAAALLICLAPSLALANPPRQIPYSGQLEQDGVKLSEPVDMLFFLVDDAAKGQSEALWSETHSGVSIYGGHFAVVLGSVTPIDPEVLARSALYLGIEVNGVALSGRKRLLPGAYSVESLAIPAGAIMPFAGTTAPEGWLLCDGSEQLIATYPRLAAVLGTSFGSASAGSFKLPDLRGRMALGMDNMGGTSANRATAASADVVGGSGGVDSNTAVPAHTHSIADGAHSHSLRVSCDNSPLCQNANDGLTRGASGLEYQSYPFNQIGGGVDPTNGSHNHGGATGSTGTASVTNLPPYLTMNYIVKF